jgi:hypothetical protein
MSRDQRRRLLRQLRDSGFAIEGGPVTLPLGLGPAPRSYYVDWPNLEARMLAEWNRHRDTILAESTAGPRPWAFFWFDRPHADTIPGPQRDALLAAGRLTAEEADRMASAHAMHAFAQIAASRPGETTADWLADPALIEKSLELVGWNVFTEETIAHLRATHRPGAAGASTTTEQEVPDHDR